jgi:hypothetical protein
VAAHLPLLRLVRERKLADLLPPPQRGAALEASGVIAKGREYFVVFDNTRRVARIGADLSPASGTHGWVSRARASHGYEDIAYSPGRRRFYLLLEAEKHPDGTYKAVIEEFDESWRRKGRCWVDVAFDKRNTGLEGLCAVRWRGNDLLLALAEGNRGKGNSKGRKGGRGRIHVLQKKGRVWKPLAKIKLPRSLNFKDYSAVSIRGERLAVISQESSRLWIGTLRRRDWTIRGAGRTYGFPTTSKGKLRYATLEGLSWLSPTRWVAVSDCCGKGPRRHQRTDQSIHIFRLGGRRKA